MTCVSPLAMALPDFHQFSADKSLQYKHESRTMWSSQFPTAFASGHG